jgi:hypothetical protein
MDAILAAQAAWLLVSVAYHSFRAAMALPYYVALNVLSLPVRWLVPGGLRLEQQAQVHFVEGIVTHVRRKPVRHSFRLC